MANQFEFSVDLEPLEEIWEDSPIKEVFEKFSQATKESFQRYVSDMGKFSQSMGKSMQTMGKQLVKAFSYIKTNKTSQLVEKQTQKLTSSLRRSILSFDQINRLNKNTGSGLDRIKQDLAGMVVSLQTTALTLGQLWDLVFAAPPGTNTDSPLTKLLKDLGLIDKQTQTNSQNLSLYGSYWDGLGTKMASWVSKTVQGNTTLGQLITTLMQSSTQADATSGRFSSLGNVINQALKSAWASMQSTWAGCGNWLTTQVTTPAEKSFSGLWSKIKQDISGTYTHTQTVFSQVGKALSQTLTTAWNAVYENIDQKGTLKISLETGVLKGLKESVNAIIRGINTVVAEPFSGLNKMLDKLQKVKIGLLSPFAALSWRVKIPTIPQLAQGAVLPANKPFLAMVGDQRHGTNVEAPLSTIQEAVALTMEDMAAGNMAGHAATVDVLQDILQAILGIRISDSAIANAYSRHQSNMAVVYGK